MAASAASALATPSPSALATPSPSAASASTASPKISLVGTDGKAVEFSATHLPTMRSIHMFSDESGAVTEAVPITAADSETLTLLHSLLDLQAAVGVPFKQPPTERTYRGICTKVPCYAGGEDPWLNTTAAGIYYKALTQIPTEALCKLFTVCDYLDVPDLLCGISYILIPHVLDYTGGVRELISPHIKQILGKIHAANCC